MDSVVPTVDTEVLVIGSGPAGAAAALFLATYGTRVTILTKYGRLSETPRAHITNQRTMETLRDMGLEERLMREATPWELMGNTTFCTSLVGAELGRVSSWGTDIRRHADYQLASPCTMVDAPQTITEPILVQAAQARGARVRFDTEYLSHVQDADGVTTRVRDRLTGAEYDVRSLYLVGADGARSKVAADAGLPFEGPGAVAGALNIIIEADLTRFVAHRPSVLYWMLQPGAEKEGVGLGVLRMIKPWSEWMLMWGYEVAAGPPDLTDDFIRQLAVQLVGTDDFEMRIKSSSPWTVNHQFASRLANGRVFCVGDAVHRHPPTNGLGSNTSIQDSYNLAWKLHHVVRGLARPSLLDSYDAERAPIARQIVERANQSIADTGRIIEALDVDDTSNVERLERQLALREAPGPDGEKIRTALREAIAYKSFEFNAHGVEHNQRYASDAVIPDGTPMPAYERDSELYAQPTTWPGAKLPHTWVTRAGHRISTLDLAGSGQFTVLTGIGGQAWVDAAAALSASLGVAIRTVVVGPAQEIEDPYGTWADLREIHDGGVLLVRPDLYIAARHVEAPENPQAATTFLADALERVLGTR
ncbi:FAD-dependent oxidoreductase [Cryptosporangium arvum]|uniref:2-polyprenyl-6-methoxyphenol hydroxylase-like oxidoreductase n=1 Tax=Cryptosporangium arvum DSM 44712 TaxID=927661 RepID=A0A010YZF0_9ACTN|nr:FAD-dependent monooxygenase [Cryptosporangium arvum]EXG80593.1 2-polyprenyl-6-methoxyphenol hydroxylase-like oxidoreductase [Cryptosporangium arvum DSM 44712]